MTEQPFPKCPQAAARERLFGEYVCCSPDTCRKLGYCQFNKLTAKEKEQE